VSTSPLLIRLWTVSTRTPAARAISRALKTSGIDVVAEGIHSTRRKYPAAATVFGERSCPLIPAI
jgi:hypothetical protein